MADGRIGVADREEPAKRKPEPGLSSPLELIVRAAQTWMRSRTAVLIVAVFYVMSLLPLWLGNLFDMRAAAAKTDFDPLGVLEPVVGDLGSQLLARLNATLLSHPSIRPVFGPTKTPWPAAFWTPDRLYLTAMVAWILGIAAFPFFIRAAVGLRSSVASWEGWRVLARTLGARIGLSVFVSIPTMFAFDVLPRVASSGGWEGAPAFYWLQQGTDLLSVVPALLLFTWPYSVAVHDMSLWEGFVWTAKAWRRRAPWIAGILAIGLVFRFLPPGMLAVAKWAGSIHWTLRLLLRSVGAAFRFWLDATVCASWAYIACLLGPNAQRDPRLARTEDCSIPAWDRR